MKIYMFTAHDFERASYFGDRAEAMTFVKAAAQRLEEKRGAWVRLHAVNVSDELTPAVLAEFLNGDNYLSGDDLLFETVYHAQDQDEPRVSPRAVPFSVPKAAATSDRVDDIGTATVLRELTSIQNEQRQPLAAGG